MCPLQDSNGTSVRDNALVEHIGADGTVIGNVGDRLKVDAIITVSKKLRYEDMNAGTGGVARGTTIVTGAAATTVYSYSGSGVLFGFLINLQSASMNSDNWQINLLVDGNEIFNTSGLNTADFIDDQIYNYNTGGSRETSALGMEMVGTTLYFDTTNTFPIVYSSSVQIKITKTIGANKSFRAGLVQLTKDT